LRDKGSFKYGKKHGEWVSYHRDGKPVKEWKGTFKNGKKIGD